MKVWVEARKEGRNDKKIKSEKGHVETNSGMDRNRKGKGTKKTLNKQINYRYA